MSAKRLPPFSLRLSADERARVVVFHEKEGRRHCHAVWSRIDAETMTAKPLPYFKNKMRELARELYLEHGWKMPTGLMNYGEADPRNYSLAEWQQAKRMKLDAAELKALFQECWAISDSRVSFKVAIEERGFKLAKGDRRGFVAVSHEGEVLSVSRYVGKRAKDVAERLGDPEGLPNVDAAKAQIAADLTPVVQGYLTELRDKRREEARLLLSAKRRMTEHHRDQQSKLVTAQTQRREKETEARKARLRRGVLGLWDSLTGNRAKTLARNKTEAQASLKRDRQERDQLKAEQRAQRRILQAKIITLRDRHQAEELEVRAKISPCGNENRAGRHTCRALQSDALNIAPTNQRPETPKGWITTCNQGCASQPMAANNKTGKRRQGSVRRAQGE